MYNKCKKCTTSVKNGEQKGNGRQNPYSRQTLNRFTQSPSVSQEHENNSVDQVHSDNGKYLLAVKDLFMDQILETREYI